MTPTEKIFFNKLREDGINDIEFFNDDSPDFIIRGVIGYEIKIVTGKTVKNIKLNKEQLNKILDKKIESFIVPIDIKGNIFKRIPINQELFEKEEFEGINIKWEEGTTYQFRIDKGKWEEFKLCLRMAYIKEGISINKWIMDTIAEFIKQTKGNKKL